MNMGGIFFLLFASEAAGGMCSPQGMWEHSVVRLQTKTYNWNQLLWQSSHSHYKRKMLLDRSQLFFTLESRGTAPGLPQLLQGPASSWEQEVQDE